MQPAHLSEPVFARLANSVWAFSQDYWRLVVAAMLATLHVAVFRGVADPWARALLLVHLGLLLLWQPFLRAEQRISPMQGFILSLVAFGVMLALDWWLLAFWVVVLAGLVGGKVFQHHARWQRLSYLVVLAYLLALLAVVILPEIAPSPEISPEIRSAAEYLLPLAFVLILALPAEPEPADTAQVIDFFYSMFLMLLLVVVILGSFTFMTLRRTGYLEALTYTVFLTAGAVLLVGLAWNPRSGFAGLNVFFVRYLFSIGLPVEQWLHFLAEQLQQASYVQAVHETGARMTHDIKNLLQSLNVLCSVAARDHDRDSTELQALIRRQLPLITQRLSETLAKLQRPNAAGETYAPAQAWWDALGRQYRGEGVEFEARNLPEDARLPRSLFDSAADNLIRNALAKRATRVHVSLDWDSSIALRVRDSGSAVPREMESALMRAPVESASGLGIGLYQAARQAESSGYRLVLETNRDGDVCFALTGPAA